MNPKADYVQPTHLYTDESFELLVHTIEGLTGMGSYLVDLPSNRISLSNGMYRLLGEDRGSVEPDPDFLDSRSNPDDLQKIRMALEQARKDKRPYRYIRRIRRNDGEWRTLECHGQTITDGDGNDLRLFGVVQDITEKSSAEQQLRESRRLLQATMDSSLEMIQVFSAVRNQQGEITDFICILNNKRSEQTYGDLLGKSLFALNPGVIDEGIFDMFKRVVETAVPDQSERFYTHEQLNGWFYQSTVKLNDGVATTISNITAQKRTETELAESKVLLQDIIDAPKIGIAVLKAIRNENGEIIDFVHDYINRASLDLPGGEDFTGKYFTAHGENGLMQLPQLTEVIETRRGNHYIREAEFRGGKVFFAITNTPLDDDRLVHTCEDVTERQDAEEQVRTAKEHLQAVLDGSLDYTEAFRAIRNETGRIIDFEWIFTNQMWNRRYGDRIGKRMLQLNPAVAETGLFDRFVKVVETGEPVNEEFYYSHEQFHRQWFHHTVVKMGDGVVINTEDITQRKTAEQEIREKQALLESVLNNTESSIMFLKPVRDEHRNITDFEYVYANDRSLQSVNRETLEGNKMTDLFPQLKNSELLKNYAHVAETGESFKGEVDIRPYGFPVWSQVFAQKFADGILVTYFDITERKVTESMLRRTEEEKQKAILNAVMETQEEERRRTAEALHNEFGQLLIATKFSIRNKPTEAERLLDTAVELVRRISGELMPQTLQDFGLETALIDLLESKLQDANIKYTLQLRGLGTRMRQVREIAVFRIIQEIVNNIVRHSKASFVTAEVEVRKTAVEIRITDNGTGIADIEAKREKKSFGLSYIYNRVHLLKGQIVVNSNVNAGTGFSIVIPLSDD
ncbi:MAG TPA: PAS domain-containing protein [Sphingobacteriaceae bacterium]